MVLTDPCSFPGPLGGPAHENDLHKTYPQTALDALGPHTHAATRQYLGTWGDSGYQRQHAPNPASRLEFQLGWLGPNRPLRLCLSEQNVARLSGSLPTHAVTLDWLFTPALWSIRSRDATSIFAYRMGRGECYLFSKFIDRFELPHLRERCSVLAKMRI
ncbi:hypothetical protein FA13DRAFT_331997 [Coprinellus micaceus]|uniref:Uncharacterized protein n=1 Tax=Coprinellus micaceus TaxID=71717 RepID=A0A4Y7TBJ1_COPMI|nr:hypothetical protein FA13DRAFT_331997 [Coprinellus micaceus]